MLQLGEDLLNGIELRTVGWKVEDPRIRRLDRLTHANDLVALQIVEDHGVAGSQHWDEAVGDVTAEAGAVGSAIHEAERTQIGGAQRRGDGCILRYMKIL